jgi:O-antigen ligase
MRVVIVVSISLMLVMLVWTGSRTGAVMFLVGFAIMFRRRLGVSAVLIIALVAGGLLAWQLINPGEDTATRIVSTENTRIGVWTSLLQDFLSSPVVGVTSQTWSENSYLLVAARAGIVGLVPFAIALALLWKALIQIQFLRRSLGSAAIMGDLVIAASISLLVGAFFEGFLYGTLTIPVLALYVYFAVAGFLIDYGRANLAYDQNPHLAEAPEMVSYHDGQLTFAAAEYQTHDAEV